MMPRVAVVALSRGRAGGAGGPGRKIRLRNHCCLLGLDRWSGGQQDLQESLRCEEVVQLGNEVQACEAWAQIA